MKKRRFFAVLIMMAMVTGFVAGCNVNRDDDGPLDVGNQELVNDRGEGNEQGGEVEKPGSTAFNSAAKYRHELGIDRSRYEGKTLTIWTFWSLSDTEAANIAAFEEATGCKVVFDNTRIWENFERDMIKAVATGDGPDICYFMSEAIPQYAMKGYLRPVSDYIDFSEVTVPLGEGTKNYYTFNGKLYTFPDFHEGSSKLYFRRDIFANASLPNPYDLWKEGKWTWDEFVKLAQAVKKTGADGEVEIWPYYSSEQSQILFSNGANYIRWEDGNPVQALDDPKAIRALEWERALSEQYEILYYTWPEGGPTAMLVSGELAMMYWGAWLISSENGDGLREVLGDKLGFAPFPRGPDLPANAVMTDNASGHREGISGAAKEPELASLFMLFKRLPVDEADEAKRESEQEAERIRIYGSLEEYQLAVDMDYHSIWNPVYGFSGLESVVGRIRGATDMTAAQAVEAYKNQAQNMIDRTWKSEG
jgi:ABC-type glycerol-3-phosphate transport system substrate-binding protein